jgi:hypothetical protein
MKLTCITMRRTTILLAAIILCTLCSTTSAIWSVADEGRWPEAWPKELELLRKQSRTMVGGMINLIKYQIPFTKRGEFEAAWPHLIKIKSKGAPIILVRGPKDAFIGLKPAGVIVHAPPRESKASEQPIDGVKEARQRWMNTTHLELVVDGLIVDLNRIQLPPDTPIIDERFSPEDKDTTARKLPEPRDRPQGEIE